MFPERPRRNRRSLAIRDLVAETSLSPSQLILPIFIQEGRGESSPIPSLPGISRLSIDQAVELIRASQSLGVNAFALFPKIEDRLKDQSARESRNRDGLLPRAIQEIKSATPEICLITDVAMDPYSSDGHDGIVRDGKILNDESLPILAEMALLQAECGADYVAPSDMMDGRVGYLRSALDSGGYFETGILAYTAKYASAYYGPFRDALDSAPKSGDKKTYQMDIRNSHEALREARLDVSEGADIVMVKPALAYLDVISKVKAAVDVPVAAYQVSGEYAMVEAAAKLGWLNREAIHLENTMAIRRAGADLIFTYAAAEIARWLNS